MQYYQEGETDNAELEARQWTFNCVYILWLGSIASGTDFCFRPHRNAVLSMSMLITDTDITSFSWPQNGLKGSESLAGGTKTSGSLIEKS